MLVRVSTAYDASWPVSNVARIANAVRCISQAHVHSVMVSSGRQLRMSFLDNSIHVHLFIVADVQQVNAEHIVLSL